MWAIVYDCSTTGYSKKFNQEIDRFNVMHSSFHCKKVVDILFISNLDYDHVSGIKRYTKEFLIKHIFIPYFPREIKEFFEKIGRSDGCVCNDIIAVTIGFYDPFINRGAMLT